jgi:hypothetical protein
VAEDTSPDSAAARSAELQRELSTLRAELADLRRRHAEVAEELEKWRGTVLEHWARAAAGGGEGTSRQPRHEVVRLREELDATHATLSWRITAPLRAVQRRRLQGW